MKYFLFFILVLEFGTSGCKTPENTEQPSIKNVFTQSSEVGNQLEEHEQARESVTRAAPWTVGPPSTLPEGWEKHVATQDIVVAYEGSYVRIKKGKRYFTFNGKIAIGWHGSYNPPQSM